MQIHFPLILDGATGTQLQKRGFSGDMCTEQWVLEHPDAIIDVQRQYIEAGSQVVYAPTFGANRVKLEENGIFNQVESYNTQLVALSRQAVGDQALVAGDIAPTGKFLAPLGDVSFEELVEIYTEQASALEKAGIDLFTIETTMTLPEARAAVLAVKSVSTKPIIVTFTCDASGKTLTGTDVTAALVVMQGMGVNAFGLNCSVGPGDMLLQLRRLREYAQVPLIAKPNAGMPEMEDGKTVYRCSPEEFAAVVPDLAEAGVMIYGGCCGTETGHIKALKETTSQAAMQKPAPLHPELLTIATEKQVFTLPVNVAIQTVHSADENLGDAIEEATDSSEPVLAIRIENEEQLENFADEQYAIAKPLCLVCEDPSLLERALRLYQGTALYEGSLGAEVLEPLGRKYGLIY